jgi:hypothetical protein
MRIYSYNNIFILPPQYIFSRWTKYAKKKSISQQKPGNKGSLLSRYEYISQKMISVSLQCSDSEKDFEDSFNKRASRVEDFLSQMSLDKGSLLSRYEYISQKMILVALQCSDSEKAVAYLEDSFNKRAPGIEDFLSQMSLDDKEVPQSSLSALKILQRQLRNLESPHT